MTDSYFYPIKLLINIILGLALNTQELMLRVNDTVMLSNISPLKVLEVKEDKLQNPNSKDNKFEPKDKRYMFGPSTSKSIVNDPSMPTVSVVGERSIDNDILTEIIQVSKKQSNFQAPTQVGKDINQDSSKKVTVVRDCQQVGQDQDKIVTLPAMQTGFTSIIVVLWVTTWICIYAVMNNGIYREANQKQKIVIIIVDHASRLMGGCRA